MPYNTDKHSNIYVYKTVDSSTFMEIYRAGQFIGAQEMHRT